MSSPFVRRRGRALASLTAAALVAGTATFTALSAPASSAPAEDCAEPLPVADLDEYEGRSVFYAAGPPEAQICGGSRVAVVGGGNSAAQAAIWLLRGGALVTLLALGYLASE